MQAPFPQRLHLTGKSVVQERLGLCMRRAVFDRSLLSFIVAGFLPAIFAVCAKAQNGDFSVVVLPDTQYYSASYPAILNSQMQWIVKNAPALNIQMVLGVGDIVNNGGSATQWTAADSAYKQLDAAHIPYFAAPRKSRL
jgi:hypothetical protein